MSDDIKKTQENDKIEEIELTEEEKQIIEENKKTLKDYKEDFLMSLGSNIAALFAFVMFIVILIKDGKGLIAVPVMMGGLPIGSVLLRDFIKYKKAVFMISAVLCYLLAIAGLIGFIILDIKI
jgi:hypothetical protein